jgi:hypothetical protein
MVTDEIEAKADELLKKLVPVKIYVSPELNKKIAALGDFTVKYDIEPEELVQLLNLVYSIIETDRNSIQPLLHSLANELCPGIREKALSGKRLSKREVNITEALHKVHLLLATINGALGFKDFEHIVRGTSH